MIRVFRVFVPTSVLALIISETVIIFFCFFLASYIMIDVDPEVLRWPGVPQMFSFRDPDGNTLYLVAPM